MRARIRGRAAERGRAVLGSCMRGGECLRWRARASLGVTASPVLPHSRWGQGGAAAAAAGGTPAEQRGPGGVRLFPCYEDDSDGSQRV